MSQQRAPEAARHASERSGLTIALCVVWGLWVGMFVLHVLLHSLTGSAGTTANVLTFAHVGLSILILAVVARGPLGLLLATGLFVRVAVMYMDLYTDVALPFTGDSDAEGFYNSAIAVSRDLNQAGETYGGLYTGIVGHIFHFVGPFPVVPQYLNVLLGLTSVGLLALITGRIGVNNRIRIPIVAIAALMPIVAIHSAILLRESFVQFLLTASLYFFLHGLLTNRWSWRVGSIMLVLAASAFHAGAIGVLIGYAAVTAFYSEKNGRLVFGFRGLAPTIPILIGLVILLLQSPDLFLAKFESVESQDEVFAAQNRRAGGSTYLTSLQIDGWASFVLYAPLRALYFIASPVPLDWRGFGDVMAFAADSIIYVAAIALALIYRRSHPDRTGQIVALLIIVVCTSLIFGAGVSNAGTAMRHRSKLVAYFLTLLALAFDARLRKRGP